VVFILQPNGKPSVYHCSHNMLQSCLGIVQQPSLQTY